MIIEVDVETLSHDQTCYISVREHANKPSKFIQGTMFVQKRTFYIFSLTSCRTMTGEADEDIYVTAKVQESIILQIVWVMCRLTRLMKSVNLQIS